jgi:hypothetical protein
MNNNDYKTSLYENNSNYELTLEKLRLQKSLKWRHLQGNST